MRTQRAAQQIVGGAHIGDPVAHRLADGVLQRLRSRRNPAHLRAQQPHAQHVQLLARHVHIAHVDHALQAQQRAHRRRRHAMLACAGLGNNALLAHALRQQSLAQRVVDLVRAGVQQVFALQVDLRAAQLFGQPLGKVERRRPPGKVLQQTRKLGLERCVGLRRFVLVLQFDQRRHQRLRHIPPAIDAKPPRPRLRRSRGKNDRCHREPPDAHKSGKLSVY